MYIIALDIAEHNMGVAEGEVDTKPRLYSEKFWREGQTRYEAGSRILDWIANRLVASRPDRLVIEAPLQGGPKFQRSPETAYLLGGMAMIVGAVCHMKNVQFREARVNTVRAHFIGHGNMPGEQAKKAVRKRCEQLGWEPSNYDESDAAAVWHWACSQVTKNVQMNLHLARAL